MSSPGEPARPRMPLPAGLQRRAKFWMLQWGEITCLKIYILQFMTIWHLGLNKSPIVAPRMSCDGCLAGGCGKKWKSEGREGFFFI